MYISSKDNKVIKLVKKLHTKKERKNSGLFVIEGEKLIREALAEKITIRYFFYFKDNPFQFNDKVECYEIPENLMEYISTTDSPAPFLAVAEINPPAAKDTEASLLLIINELQDPGNFGTILRSAEAAGVDTVVCSKNTVDLFNPKVIRSSMGSAFRQPVIYTELPGYLEKLKNTGWKFIMTTPHGGTDFYKAEYGGKIALFIGNEGKGINEEMLQNNECIKIPMLGKVESLNTAIAASLILYEIMKQKA